MSQHARIVRASDLDALPVGSIVIDALILDAPVVACKAQAGDWVLMGDNPDRRWTSWEMFRDAEEQLRVIWNPAEEIETG